MFYGGEMNVGGAGGNLAGIFRERMQQGGIVPTQDPRLAGISFDINESAKNRKMRGMRKLSETGVGGEKDAAIEMIKKMGGPQLPLTMGGGVFPIGNMGGMIGGMIGRGVVN